MPPISSRIHRVRTATAKASTQDSGMSYSTVKSSTASRRHKSSSNSGVGTTIRGDRIHHRDADRLRRNPSFRWTHRQLLTNIQIGPINRGGSVSVIRRSTPARVSQNHVIDETHVAERRRHRDERPIDRNVQFFKRLGMRNAYILEFSDHTCRDFVAHPGA